MDSFLYRLLVFSWIFLLQKLFTTLQARLFDSFMFTPLVYCNISLWWKLFSAMHAIVLKYLVFNNTSICTLSCNSLWCWTWIPSLGNTYHITCKDIWLLYVLTFGVEQKLFSTLPAGIFEYFMSDPLVFCNISLWWKLVSTMLASVFDSFTYYPLVINKLTIPIFSG